MKLDRYSLASESSKAGSAYSLIIGSGEQSLNPSKKSPSLGLGREEERKGGVLFARQNNTIRCNLETIMFFSLLVCLPSNISSSHSCELICINQKISTFMES